MHAKFHILISGWENWVHYILTSLTLSCVNELTYVNSLLPVQTKISGHAAQDKTKSLKQKRGVCLFTIGEL